MTYAMRPLPEDVFGMPFPIAHIGGLASFIAMVEVGGCMVLVDPFVPDEAVAFMRRHAITICGGAAPHFAALLEEQRKHPTGALLPTMRMGCGGGAPRDRELHHRLVAEMGVPLVYGYGMTECGTICMPTLDDTDEQLSYTEGLPVPGVELRIVDDGDATLPDGTEGEIHVRGTPVCDGYVDPETTAQAFTDDGWLRTGDRGRIRPDGRLVLTGRSKDLIIRKGENISAQEIEMVLMAMDAVLGVAVIGLPDRERGERVCAVVEARVGVAPPTLEDVVAHCRSHRLMVQKFPEQLEIVELLPRNSMLKVMKAQLRERFASSDDAGARP
ncbi:MAG: AMP-dependent synthetase and ligase [Acidimicrobiia bacterium]|nr:AMP-dependent synthetase and ligase [Acidimicrobiia bacterium]